jgi:hypothetical protein
MFSCRDVPGVSKVEVSLLRHTAEVRAVLWCTGHRSPVGWGKFGTAAADRQQLLLAALAICSCVVWCGTAKHFQASTGSISFVPVLAQKQSQHSQCR